MTKLHGSATHRHDGLVVFYENQRTHETRHCFVSHDAGILRFHAGFTVEDSANGWKPVGGMGASVTSDADIDSEHIRLANRARA